MKVRRMQRYRPSIERFEQKLALSGAAVAAQLAHPRVVAAAAHDAATHPGTSAQQVHAQILAARAQARVAASSRAAVTTQDATKPQFGFLVYRITNPNAFNDTLKPPFSHVLVQTRQPIPGQTYNILYVAVRNGTAQTFDANSKFFVKFPGTRQNFPILTGNQQWKPGQEFVFYVLTKKYYPVPSVVDSGYEFSLGGAYSAAIPGPSGIVLRIKYNPATFDHTLDQVVAYGQGAQGGRGPKFGLPDTAIYELLNAKTRRIDFGGYF